MARRLTIDPWFTNNGIDFDLAYNNVDGAGTLTLQAVPEPSTAALCFGLLTLGLFPIRRGQLR